MTLDELIEKLQKIKKMGFVKTVRAHQGGVGNTLEYLLEVPENNLRLPDIGEIEIKAKRYDSQSMLTLSSRAPQKRGTNKVLFKNYKYIGTDGIYRLYSTVYGSRKNTKGFGIDVQNGKLVLLNPKNIEAFWPLEKLDDIFKEKSSQIVLVLAYTKGSMGKSDERFHYVEAYLLSGLNLNNTRNAIKRDKLKVDIRIGFDLSGKRAREYHDHGTGFRISKRDYIHLFGKVKQLI